MLLLISFDVLSEKGRNQKKKMANNTFFVRNVTPSFPHEPFFLGKTKKKKTKRRKLF